MIPGKMIVTSRDVGVLFVTVAVTGDSIVGPSALIQAVPAARVTEQLMRSISPIFENLGFIVLLLTIIRSSQIAGVALCSSSHAKQ